jgi:NO-binding membrane sensor protein with MHYT domain
MHFVGMLAMRMPIVMHYDLVLTIASFVVALIAATLAINVVVSEEMLPFKRLILATCLLCLGIVGMHALGMAALTDYVTLYWNTPRLILSVTIAFLPPAFRYGLPLFASSTITAHLSIGFSLVSFSVSRYAPCIMWR